MSKSLYVVLLPGRLVAETAFDYLLCDENHALQQQGRALTAQLPPANALCLLVPPEMLSWHRLRLPPVASARLPQVLAGLLEDRLLDDPVALAFAVGGPAQPDGTRSVAALDKVWLRGAMDWFEQHGRTVARVLPQFAPAAADSGQLRLLALGSPEHGSLVLVGPDVVLTVPLDTGATELVALGYSGILPLWADAALAMPIEVLLGRPGRVLQASDRWLSAARSGWELAQFDLAISRHARLLRRLAQRWKGFWRDTRWRPFRWGALLLLLANVAGLNAWAWRLEANLLAKREQAKATLLQAFPKVRTVIDAPLQMGRELALVRRSSGALAETDLEAMLAAAGSVVPAGAGATGIEFAAGTLTLTGTGLTSAQWASANERLARQGYSARLEADRLTLRLGAGP